MQLLYISVAQCAVGATCEQQRNSWSSVARGAMKNGMKMDFLSTGQVGLMLKDKMETRTLRCSSCVLVP